MIGAETLLPLALAMVREGLLPLGALLHKLTAAPAAIFDLPGGSLAPGAPADLVVFDEGAPWRIDGDAARASAGNTPFDGMPTQGRAVMTMKGGEVVWDG